MKVLLLVVALTVGALITAFILPIGIDAVVEDSTLTVNQTEAETIEVTEGLNATLDDVDDSTSDIDVTLNATAPGAGSATLTNISPGANATATLEGETITVTNDKNISNTNAEVTYAYPPDYGWSGGAQALWGILDVIIVLAVFMILVGIAMRSMNSV